MATKSSSSPADEAGNKADINNVSDLGLEIAKVRAQAAEELGSIKAAEQWLMAPAMGLDQRRPIDLLGSMEEIALVTQLLSRIRYGIYT
ncbi:MAG: DUF2384 domain-containing protein [Polaromonas sp.]|uniref:antitoxin Xre/MbcA/ParS toxin-binding domain-containing protein n=1 Tax=Polaromonas sp. TaxID=1869339 RepID=UPI0027164BC6|nr:antitoxin Xre/MbcA/ParS toxin-binding domain-containing protein [Polaromonas sp.]MDO9113899.1 DUF2384 domain-containing protein [Polaromonas sp.]MDP1888240.1 DUF2384 domain-containing protein [Polaromonas sp.]